jgi:hypothetical protein
MDFINFDISKTLDELETASNTYARKASYISRSHKLRKVPVKDLTTEELRLMIMQNSSLVHLVPLAIQRLNLDSLLKGGYEGDLLNAVLTIEKKFWKTDLNGYIPMIKGIVEKAAAIVKANPVKYLKFTQNSSGAMNIFEANIGHL